MVGLGPNGSSLLERTGHKFEITEDWLILDRQERSQARRAAMIKWSMKKKKAQKPVAPVEPAGFIAVSDNTKKLGFRKVQGWVWKGESNGLVHDTIYKADEIRTKGFKLPKLNKKEGKKHG